MSRRFGGVVVCFLALVMGSTASFAQETQYTRLLLPVTPSLIEGQNGARWLTELSIGNSGFEEISLFCFSEPCVTLPARTIARAETPATDTVVPGLLYVPTSQARRFNAALRSRNRTPNSDERDFVSEIPVAREEEFRSSIIELLAVPIEANYRHMLRIYDVNATEGAQVRVRIYGLSPDGGLAAGAPIVDEVLELRTPRGTASPFARPDQPSWVAFPDFSDRPGVRQFNEVHIRIETVSGNTMLWAFVTATNNTTQRFAVYTP